MLLCFQNYESSIECSMHATPALLFLAHKPRSWTVVQRWPLGAPCWRQSCAPSGPFGIPPSSCPPLLFGDQLNPFFGAPGTVLLSPIIFCQLTVAKLGYFLFHRLPIIFCPLASLSWNFCAPPPKTAPPCSAGSAGTIATLLILDKVLVRY